MERGEEDILMQNYSNFSYLGKLIDCQTTEHGH